MPAPLRPVKMQISQPMDEIYHGVGENIVQVFFGMIPAGAPEFIMMGPDDFITVCFGQFVYVLDCLHGFGGVYDYVRPAGAKDDVATFVDK